MLAPPFGGGPTNTTTTTTTTNQHPITMANNSSPLNITQLNGVGGQQQQQQQSVGHNNVFNHNQQASVTARQTRLHWYNLLFVACCLNVCVYLCVPSKEKQCLINCFTSIVNKSHIVWISRQIN